MLNDRNYLIMKVEELNKVDFSQVLETSADSVRKCKNEIYTFVKWEGDEPDFVNTLVDKYGPYSHQEILEILSDENWGDNMAYE
jgi:hypothetical protein